MVYERFILNIPVLHNKHVFSQTCMIFMTSDGNVLVTTTGLGWSAYEQRDNPMGLCPLFSFEIHINWGMIKLWNELLDHVRIGANLGTINPFKDHGTGGRSIGYGRAPLTVLVRPLRVLLCPCRSESTLKSSTGLSASYVGTHINVLATH
ncbi:hypothetical protein HanIR_Chr16g0803311 [Helianthus annuus]|nr:hypothetical protein HanIR_Chr16g0803311 [Helianthus annuus]